MLYEVSNQTYNHKLSEHEVSHNGPFQKMVGRGKKKTPQDFYLTKDTPENLLKIYQAGHCLKPHAFTSEDKSSRMMVNAIVLDFDHLTKSQLDFVKSISRYGDYSAGMKTQLHHNKDIPGWQPSEWKYKVFHPYPCSRLELAACSFGGFRKPHYRRVPSVIRNPPAS